MTLRLSVTFFPSSLSSCVAVTRLGSGPSLTHLISTGLWQAYASLLHVSSRFSCVASIALLTSSPFSRCNECVELFQTEPELRKRFEEEQAETAAKLKEMGIEL
jgi:hypothetical protein